MGRPRFALHASNPSTGCASSLHWHRIATAASQWQLRASRAAFAKHAHCATPISRSATSNLSPDPLPQGAESSSALHDRQVFLPVQHQFPVEIGDSQTDESVFRILFAAEVVLSLAGSLGVDAMSENPATQLTRAGPLVSQPAHTPSHPLRVIAEPTPDHGRSSERLCPERCASSLPRTEYGAPVFTLLHAGSSSRCFFFFFPDGEVPATRSSRLHKLSVRNRLRHFHPASKPCPSSSRIDYLRTSFTQFADMGMLTWYG